MYVEEKIIALRQQTMERPFGWLICFEDRPLQGIPRKGKGPHLLFFSEEDKAQAFIFNRKSYYGDEPLSPVRVDSPETLKTLALQSSSDPRYATPPGGIVLDFDYPSNQFRKILSPGEVSSWPPAEIARAFGYRSNQDATLTSAPPEPSQQVDTGQQPGKRSLLKITLITCGILLVAVICLLGIGGIWFAMTRGMIPSLPFFHTPTSIQPPTTVPTPTPAQTPTAAPTLTATPAAWDIQIKDDFSMNIHGWPVGQDTGQYGSSNLAIQNGKLVWQMTSINNCWYWWYPDLQSMTDFVVSMDVQRKAGSTNGDYGVVVRLDGDQNSFYYFGLNDTNQEFAFLLYQNDDWTRIQDWTYASSVRTGEINRIEVRATGSQFTFLINGTVVGNAEDARLASGKVAILAELYDSNDNITIEYDNLVLQGSR